MTLLLSHEDVQKSVSMADAIEAMEAGFLEEGGGGVLLPPRINIKAGKGWLRVGPVVMESSGWMGFKAMNLTPGQGVRYQVHLYSIASGALEAIMDAQFLTTLRTGATSAVAMVSAFFFTSAKFVSGNGPTSPVRWHWVQFSKISGAMFFVKVTGPSAAAA